MGTTQSTRKITLVNDEKAGVIKLSESLAHRLRGQLEATQAAADTLPMPPSPSPPPQEPILPPHPPLLPSKPLLRPPISEPIAPPLPTPPPVEPAPEVEVQLMPEPTEPLLTVSEPEPSLPVLETEPELVIQTPLAPVPELQEPSDITSAADINVPIKRSPTFLPPWAAYAEEAHLMVVKLREEKQTQINKFDEEYRAKLKAREQEYIDLARISQEEFQTSFKEVEALFRKASCTPVCQDVQEDVMKCYQDHPRQSLRCSGEVSKFSRCVDLSRLQAVMKEKAS